MQTLLEHSEEWELMGSWARWGGGVRQEKVVKLWGKFHWKCTYPNSSFSHMYTSWTLTIYQLWNWALWVVKTSFYSPEQLGQMHHQKENNFYSISTQNIDSIQNIESANQNQNCLSCLGQMEKTGVRQIIITFKTPAGQINRKLDKKLKTR